MATNGFVNEQLAIAHNHLQLGAEELSSCADKLYETLSFLEEHTDNEEDKNRIIEALAALQMQDIITQRLAKVRDFLASLDKEVTLPTDEGFLREFAWENEVDQNDIDAMFEEYKG